jgi:hypothetical protein
VCVKLPKVEVSIWLAVHVDLVANLVALVRLFVTGVVGVVEMTYPKCVEVLKLIQSHAEAEGTAGKNLFGTYTNKALKDWHEIVRAYQSSNLFLVEAARVMTQLTDYDVYVLAPCY